MAHVESDQTPHETKVPAYFKEALEDSERLLKYAAEMGIEVDAETRTAVLNARAVYPDGWTEDAASRLLLALTCLADRVKPVTAASLKAYHVDTRPTMHTYLMWAIILSAIIIPASIVTFVTSNISEAIRTDTVKANALVVKLSTELSPSAQTGVGLTDKIADLQEYAATTRLIYARANRLNRYVFPHVEIPQPLQPPATATDALQRAQYLKQKFELPVPVTNDNAMKAGEDMTETYQDVRFFAQSIVTDIATFYGAINSCVLPVLYALLGTCAYLLRTFEDQMSTRTFIPSHANSARFLIAAIGGTVVGLFGNFSQQASASPLAVAFLVGYAVEVFFSFLEGLIKAFTKSTPPSSPPRLTATQGKA
jgi:hypothetical protein